jgi:urease accessory protein
MLHAREVVTQDPYAPVAAARVASPDGIMTLTFDDRRRSRLLAKLDDGREVALLLPRGTVLRDGDRVRADEDGLVFVVRAAAETLSVGRTDDPHTLTVAAYHLGNRHVPLQIGDCWLAYAHDHVLDDMARGLGLEVETRVAPFEPEPGAHRHEPRSDPAPHHHHGETHH